ncbi:hypothetical protein AXH09_21700 [Pseudomonas aeruginosa]|nr:hypothetical protein M770_10035 [Pseudomonas aeruginosa VRFPA03]KYQ67491.1 hypothetical protein AXH09_21700 [Pseudomonas aeruginosa]
MFMWVPMGLDSAGRLFLLCCCKAVRMHGLGQMPFPWLFSCARLAVDALLLGPAEAEMDCEDVAAVRGADPVRLGRLAKVNLAPGIFMV